MATTDQILSWRGRELYDRDGDKIGKIDEVYLDTTTNQPEWALVNTGLFGRKSTFVPLRDAETSGEEVRIAHTKSHVKDAPGIDPDGKLSESEEAELYRHYDLDYPAGDGADSGVGNGRTTRDVELLGDDDDEARRESGDGMTRSEEELSVGTSQREAGRARLRKYVETEDVSETVPVRREEARVEREPITDANRDRALAGEDITDAEHEVVLHEEEPVVEKRTVPKERVRLETDTVTEEREVSDQVRRERIEVEGDARDD
jgi:uncharacterized protein (TIGR02271 family)